jgi:hypothetical protein
MKETLKKFLSKRAIVIVLVVVLALSALNTYMIFEGTRSSLSTSTVNYDYVLSQDGDNYKLKNMLTGFVTDEGQSASNALNNALSGGKSIYLNGGTYTLTGNVNVSNKLNPKIISDGAVIVGNGYKIIIRGDDYTTSKYATISGLTLINATIRVENSFGVTIENTLFQNTTTGIEFANTNTWTEYTKIENCQFINASEGIAFRSPAENGTGSYSSSQIDRCSFNIRDNSVGINIEPLAEFSDCQLQDVRFWLGEDGAHNQTALLNNGAMSQTLLFGVVFESFTDAPNDVFGIDLGETCDSAPVLDGGVSFLGNWTAKIHNPYGIWLSSVDCVFDREHESVPVGVNNQYGANTTIEVHPLKISSFKPRIEVGGNFKEGELVTVRVRVEYIDNSISTSVARTFNSTGSAWLSDDDILALFPSQNIIWDILVDAKSSMSSTGVWVRISGYGNAG